MIFVGLERATCACKASNFYLFVERKIERCWGGVRTHAARLRLSRRSGAVRIAQNSLCDVFYVAASLFGSHDQITMYVESWFPA